MTTGKKYNDTVVDEKNNQIEIYDHDNGHLVFDIYNQDNPYSVINTLPKLLRPFLDQVPEELREMTTEELREIVEPDKTVNQLRLKFWKEYDSAIGSNRKMSVMKIAAGTCSVPILKKIMANREKAAWILTPIMAYNIGVEELMETTLSKLRKKIDEIDVSSAKDLNVLLKIYETFDKRVHGEYKRNDKITVENKGSANGGQISFGSSKDIKNYIEQNKLEGKIK